MGSGGEQDRPKETAEKYLPLSVHEQIGKHNAGPSDIIKERMHMRCMEPVVCPEDERWITLP